YHKKFDRFLSDIPQNADLILNGDIIDSPLSELWPGHKRIMQMVAQVSYRQRVIWLRGNHDNGYIPEDFGEVQFKRIHAIEKRLLIAHGDDFDEIMPRSQAFMKAFRFMHNLRVKLGAKPVHVAHYAKRWKNLYKMLRHNVMVNAVNCALEKGFDAVACGHTHFPEEAVFKGVRYINTGSWTEFPAFCLKVTDSGMALMTVDDDFDWSIDRRAPEILRDVRVCHV
ncbi:MAG: metallophosphoesterase, partial [Deltaproteobacteria bacterium]|nr:metallophosphoesterase [Deltaproteobacteria bacterium]